jgi:hypothetical protein
MRRSAYCDEHDVDRSAGHDVVFGAEREFRDVLGAAVANYEDGVLAVAMGW